MKLRKNKFKAAIKRGDYQIGLWSGLRSTLVAEMLTQVAAFDWTVVDMEHSPNELVDVLLQLQVAQQGHAEPMVRVPWNDPVMVKRVLDIGAQTIRIPMIQNAEAAAAAVAAVRYPQNGGVRGVMSLARMNNYGATTDYYLNAHKEMCVIVQCETEEAVENIPEIAKVPGVDGIFVGPSDLSASMGHIGNPYHASVQKMIKKAVGYCKKAGKPAGYLTGDEVQAKQMIDWGYTYVAVGSDMAVLTNSSRALANRFQEYVGKKMARKKATAKKRKK